MLLLLFVAAVRLDSIPAIQRLPYKPLGLWVQVGLYVSGGQKVCAVLRANGSYTASLAC